jgi:hypothetical protein
VSDNQSVGSGSYGLNATSKGPISRRSMGELANSAPNYFVRVGGLFRILD